MNAEVTDAVICTFVAALAERLDQTAAVAKAAQACLVAGHRQQAVAILLDIESRYMTSPRCLTRARGSIGAPAARMLESESVPPGYGTFGL